MDVGNSILILILLQVMLAGAVISRTWKFTSGKLFAVTTAGFITSSLGVYKWSIASTLVVAERDIYSLVVGLALVEMGAILLISRLYMPAWWEKERGTVARWISLPYLVGVILVIGLPLLPGGKMVELQKTLAIYDFTLTPIVGWLMFWYAAAGWLVIAGLLVAAFRYQPRSRSVIIMLSLPLLIGMPLVLMQRELSFGSVVGYLPIQNFALIAVLSYAVFRECLHEPIRLDMDVTMRALSEAVIMIDNNYTIRFQNPAADKLHLETGVSLVDNFKAVLSEAEFVRFTELLERFGPNFSHKFVFPGEEGFPRIYELTMTPMLDDLQIKSGFLIVGRDLTELEERSRELEQERLQLSAAVSHLDYLARHDPLTNLPNRRTLSEQVEKAVAYARLSLPLSDKRAYVMFLDLDNFKVVNDTLNHSAGDELLLKVTAILQNNVRQGDLMARFGGDEFALVVNNRSQSEALAQAERLRSLIGDQPFEIMGHYFNVGVSIGIVPINGQTQAEELLSRADTAMYRAKQQGRNRVVIFEEADLVAPAQFSTN